VKVERIFFLQLLEKTLDLKNKRLTELHFLRLGIMFERSGAGSGSDQRIAKAKSTVYHCAGEVVNETGNCASECLESSMCS
jgi:hypothetical protein